MMVSIMNTNVQTVGYNRKDNIRRMVLFCYDARPAPKI